MSAIGQIGGAHRYRTVATDDGGLRSTHPTRDSGDTAGRNEREIGRHHPPYGFEFLNRDKSNFLTETLGYHDVEMFENDTEFKHFKLDRKSLC